MSFLLDPYRLAVAGGGSSAPVMAVAPLALPAGTANFDVTTAQLGGEVPTAALVFICGDTSGSSPTPDAIIAIGAVNASSAIGFGAISEDNLANTNCERVRNGSGAFISVHDAVGAPNDIYLDSFIAGGFRINRGAANNAGTTGYRGFAIFFAGGATVGIGTQALGTGTSALTIGSLPVAPELVFLFGHSDDFATSPGTFYAATFGIATSSAQRCFFIDLNDGLSFVNINGHMRNDYAAAQRVTYGLTVNNFTANSFDITPSASTASDDIAYLWVNLNGKSAKIVDFTARTSTGSQSLTGAGFTPRFAMSCMTDKTSYATGSITLSSGNINSTAISAFDATNSRAVVNFQQHLSDPSNTESFAPDSAIAGGSTSTSTAVRASLTSFDADGVTLNYSAVSGTAHQGFMLLVE